MRGRIHNTRGYILISYDEEKFFATLPHWRNYWLIKVFTIDVETSFSRDEIFVMCARENPNVRTDL